MVEGRPARCCRLDTDTIATAPILVLRAGLARTRQHSKSPLTREQSARKVFKRPRSH
jgi:hypothetical protein